MRVITDGYRPITHVYGCHEEAARVVDALEAAGVPRRDITLVSSDRDHAGSAVADGGPDAPPSEAGTGATLGTVLGGGVGLLAGLGALAIPGAGPVVAGGWLLATLAGAGLGAATGGLLGLLTGAGVEEADARAYADLVERGGTLVTVHAQDATAASIERIMRPPPPAWLDQRASGPRQQR